MDLKKFVDNVKDRYDDYSKKKRIEKIASLEGEEISKYKEKVNRLLDKFEIPDFDEFLSQVLGKKLQLGVETDEYTGRRTRRINPGRKKYLDFIWDPLYSSEIKFEQLKDFALKRKIVSPSFFGNESDGAYEKSDFGTLINAIKAGFEPEKITKEEDLEAQLTIFLKAKFPERKIRRQVTIQGNNRLDILIDDKYVFELKVPRQRDDLRNLGAQLEEYKEMYPNVCGIIFEDVVEGNLSQDIMDYVDKYKRNYGIDSIVLGGTKRNTL